MPPDHKYALPAGFRLNQYTIVRLLGHGGFALTYLADHARLNRKVAIKELLPVDFAIREADGTTVVARSQQDKSNFEWARERFVEEGQTLAGLHHPSILQVHDILEEHGTAYLVTPFIDGGSMEDWLREVQRPSESDLRSITHHILDALALVHERGYLHRDVKPQNILMDRHNGLPVLIDFGNARMASGAKTSNLTSVLTKGYAPFEQYQTKTRQGAFTDIYSLGAVLYRAVTGAAPEDAADRVDEDKVKPLCQFPQPGYSLNFLATVDKALQMRREDRWQKCRDWKDALYAKQQTDPEGGNLQLPKPPISLAGSVDVERQPRATERQEISKDIPGSNGEVKTPKPISAFWRFVLYIPAIIVGVPMTTFILLVILGGAAAFFHSDKQTPAPSAHENLTPHAVPSPRNTPPMSQADFDKEVQKVKNELLPIYPDLANPNSKLWVQIRQIVTESTRDPANPDYTRLYDPKSFRWVVEKAASMLGIKPLEPK